MQKDASRITAGVVILILKKQAFKRINFIKERNGRDDKRLIHQEDITIANTYTFNNISPEFMKKS